MAETATASPRWWTPAAWLSPRDLLREPLYRRLWTSVLISSFGGQITMLALPLAAAVLLHATPTQMGWLSAMELAPFVLFSLPAGVWLDRMRKLPVYVAGEGMIALAVGSIPAAWALGWLSMPFLYGVAFLIGSVYVTAGSAAQIVLTQIVPRERLVEAHAKNALAGSIAEVAGPGAAGALIRMVGAPFALLADAVLLVASVLILRGLKIEESPHALVKGAFRAVLVEGMRFVAGHKLLVLLAVLVGSWQLCNHMAMVMQVLFATRELGLDEGQLGLCYIGLGIGTISAGFFGDRLSSRLGVGRCLLLGIFMTGIGWIQLAFAPANRWGVASFVLMLMCFGVGAVLIFINFLALRQSVTPQPLLGRMTSTMRWLILLPAPLGALIGGWLGEHLGLRYALAAGGFAALAVAGVGLVFTHLRDVRQLPQQAH
ncbi:MFS transporter [Ramlibacter sp. CrO1]|uniref:MFS transporter n=2 Tax=Ramlibacter algicola TaxID=2795217 RepID=A0A934PZL4_9BURK|nr:MFS transporter [Ramlibacter algicola]